MSCTDPIADMLTVIRNGIQANKPLVTVPHSSVKQGIAQVLLEEGYITKIEVLETKPAKSLRIGLKYGDRGESPIHEIRRVSTPGRRSYAEASMLKPIMRGLGISVISTSQGILSDRSCRTRKLGGEVICIVK